MCDNKQVAVELWHAHERGEVEALDDLSEADRTDVLVQDAVLNGVLKDEVQNG